MSHTASSSTEIGDEVLAKLTAPVNPQTLESINSPVRPHSHPFLRFLRRRPAKALAHQLSQSLPHGHLPQALQSLLTCHLHQFTMNPSSRIYRETTKDGEMTVDLDAYRAMTAKEFHGQRIPVHIRRRQLRKIQHRGYRQRGNLLSQRFRRVPGHGRQRARRAKDPGLHQ